MEWIKRAHVYAPDGTRWWAQRNALFPTVDVRGDVLRVFFVALDADDFGRTGYVDLDAEDPSRVLYESPEPVLDIGELGAFDDCGANAFSVLTRGHAKYLYYQGWQRTERGPYLCFTGLAIDESDGRGFRKYSRTPILDRVENDLLLRGAPCVIKDGDAFRMWYASCRRWIRDEHGLHYEIVIRHASSSDGITWISDETPCIELESPDEYGIGSPSVLLEDGRYRMWYSIRCFSRPYRIGYAESQDGVTWTRRDAETGIARSAEGWDSEMICYPHVVRVGDRLLMFYNGNRERQCGFGYAQAAV